MSIENCRFAIIKRAVSQEIVVIAYANSKGSGESAHPRSIARAIAFCSYNLQIKGNLQPKN